jgi:hypothetical protein
MMLPLATAFAVAGVDVPALLAALAVVSAFLAHEPLLVLLGGRGLRIRREMQRRAAAWLVAEAAVALIAGGAAIWSLPPGDRWLFLLPSIPVAFLGAAVLQGREKSTEGEIAVAIAFALAGVPVAVAAGAPLRPAFSLGIAFGVVFVAGTLSVRAIVLGTRGGGDPRAARAMRLGVLVVTVGAAVAILAAASRGVLPWTTLAAPAPGIAAVAWLTVFPPPASRLRTVGWTLAASSVAAGCILVLGLAAA